MNAPVIIQIFLFYLFVGAYQLKSVCEAEWRIYLFDNSPVYGVCIHKVIALFKQPCNVFLLTSQNAVVVISCKVACKGYVLVIKCQGHRIIVIGGDHHCFFGSHR